MSNCKKGPYKDPFIPETAFYSRLFSCSQKKGGSMPLVIDLSSLNKFIVKEHFQPGDFMTNIDLKDTFLSLFTSLTESFFASFGREHVTSSKLFHSAPRIFTNVFDTCRSIPEEKAIRVIASSLPIFLSWLQQWRKL